MAKILITDDSMFMRMTLATILKKVGHETCEASNGEEMLKIYDVEKPDIVTLDITMPVMDGLAALKELRKRHSDAKVIMCSAMGQKAMVVEAVQNGAYDFIVKPFKEDRVYETINKAVK